MDFLLDIAARYLFLFSISIFSCSWLIDIAKSYFSLLISTISFRHYFCITEWIFIWIIKGESFRGGRLADDSGFVIPKLVVAVLRTLL